VWTHAKVLDSLTGVLGTTEQEGVATSGGTESKLIESQSFTTGSKDASTGSGSESERSDAELGNRKQTVVIGDGADNNDGLALGTLLGVAY